MVDDKYFVIERPGHKGRVKLGPEAKFWAEQNGMTVRQMARYLLAQNSDDEYSGTPEELEAAQNLPSTAVAGEDFLSGVTPSENVEDRRQEPEYVNDPTMKQIWGQMPHDVAPHATTYGVNPLSAALGFRDVGNRPASAPQVMGPTEPQWPAAFGPYHNLPF